ncbi:hypothetical protein BZA70DRAFT_64447 [Myxozyma melibiosi]|uniref:Uncharacterized protein n=1 Tax=Myxozyma melibiosi TaxID=54550 RepID=A0ABR1F2B6_9ASCO
MNFLNFRDPLVITEADSYKIELLEREYELLDRERYTPLQAEAMIALSLRGIYSTFHRLYFERLSDMPLEQASWEDDRCRSIDDYIDGLSMIMTQRIRPRPKTLGIQQRPEETVYQYWERVMYRYNDLDCSAFNVSEEIFNGLRPELREGVMRRLNYSWREKGHIPDKNLMEAAAIVETSVSPENCSLEPFQPRAEISDLEDEAKNVEAEEEEEEEERAVEEKVEEFTDDILWHAFRR